MSKNKDYTKTRYVKKFDIISAYDNMRHIFMYYFVLTDLDPVKGTVSCMLYYTSYGRGADLMRYSDAVTFGFMDVANNMNYRLVSEIDE